MQLMQRLSSGLVFLALTACNAPVHSEQRTVTSSATPTSAHFSLTMSRSGCFGRCPSYEVAIQENGTVQFTGVRDVAKLGVSTGRVDAPAYARLRNMLASRTMSSLAERYTPDSAKCRFAATDQPTVRLKITQNQLEQRIEHYLGCEDVPALLEQLESAIDTAARTDRWITGREIQ